jgi:hypothetical protein
LNRSSVLVSGRFVKVVTVPVIFRSNHVETEGLRHINPIRARLLMVFGPADSWDNPLCGTKYDPLVRQHREHQRRAERRLRHECRHGVRPHA